MECDEDVSTANLPPADALKRAIDGMFECPQCDYSSKNKSHLTAHLLRHDVGVTWYSCTLCEYNAKRKQYS